MHHVVGRIEAVRFRLLHIDVGMVHDQKRSAVGHRGQQRVCGVLALGERGEMVVKNLKVSAARKK